MLSAIAARKAAKSVTTTDEAALRKNETSDAPAVRPSKTPRSSKRKVSTRDAEEPRVGTPKRQKPISASNSNSKINGGKKEKKAVAVVVAGGLREAEGDDDSFHSGLSTDDDDEVPVDSLPPARGRRWSPSAPVVESGSDVEEPEVNISTFPTRSPTTFQPFEGTNTIRLTSDEVRGLGLNTEHGNAVALALSVGQRFCLLGAYNVVAVHGSLEACGAIFNPSTVPRPHRVFAPKCSHLPSFECIPTSSTSIPSPCPSHPRLQPVCQKFDAVVVIQELLLGVDGLERVFGTFNGMFRESQQEKTNGEVRDIGLRGVQMVTQQTRSLQPLTLLPSWNAALLTTEPPPSNSSSVAGVFIVKGPKKTGKSTFAVTLLNKLLSQYTRVAFLECDIGQSEFGPAGMVSLHVVDKPVLGPAFTHPSLPLRAHFIGSTSPRSSPSHYLASIDSLFQTYHTEVQTPGLEPLTDNRISEYIPLVVNTMGWVKGLGANLLESIEEIVQPTHVFEFESSTSFPSRSSRPSPSTAQHRFLQPFISSLAYTAADQRSLSILSYFHSVFPDRDVTGDASADFAQITPDLWDTSVPLCARFPFEVDCPTAFERVILVGCGSEDVVPEQVHTVLNGALVALIACEEGALDSPFDPAFQTIENHFSVPYTQGSPPPSPAASTCLGLALIRGISPDKQKLHILTPLPPSALARCRVLVKGEVELPIWGMLDFRDQEEGVLAGFEKQKMPYLQWGKSEGVGVEKRRVRRNLMRRSQI